MMRTLESNTVYKNPLPQLSSRQSFFPFLAQLKDGSLLAAFVIGQAFESVDSASYVAYSYDGGKTWSEPQKMFEMGEAENRLTDYCKVTALADGRLVAMGYTYLRDDPALPIGNPATGGTLQDFVFWSVSEDGGKTWAEMKKIDCVWGPYVEASAPITVLQDGTWITPITGFPDWEGKLHGKLCGRALRSEDQGETWNDDAICMDFGDKNITCYEQRMCQLESGTVICIGWNEDLDSGERLQNHYTFSTDGGKTWSCPLPTGVMGQASSVCHIGGERLLALHAVRRDTDRPGIYGYIIDFSEKQWNVVDSLVVWEPKGGVKKAENMAEIFAFLKFGQPGAILLNDGNVMMSHWYAEDGQYSTVATKIEL
ncbi:MAG: exo-alpha-sialidase [Oscillospiraceae bacterium]|nr:exo-alpha-sialidase [Oscillospiraceae bacterium]